MSLVRVSGLLVLVAFLAISVALNAGQRAPRSSATGGQGIVSVGYDHTCALLATSEVRCWGSNNSGQLGDGSITNSSTPADVCGGDCSTNLSDVKSVSAGREHTCVLTNSGGVKCWGANSLTQLGNGSSTNSSVPVDVSGLSSGVAQVAAGRYYTCVVTSSHGVKCWGSNFYGQLGDATNTDRATPADVLGLQSGVASIETERYHTCALMTNHIARCWGDNTDGQVGHPGVTGTNTPVDVCADVDCTAVLSDVVAVSLGLHSTCELMTSGGVKCWGANDFGQLGNGTTVGGFVPGDVPGLTSGVVALSVGESNVCVLLEDTHVKCWGDNRFGQLGNGTTANSNVPVDVCADEACPAPLSDVAAISVGPHHACAIMLAGGVKCWGLNTSGQLGDGTTMERDMPVDALVAGVKPVPTITATPPKTPSPTPRPTVAATPTQQRGDANCDRAVNSVDAALILQYGAGLLSTLGCPTGADANHDGRINAIDAALILQYVAGLLPGL